MNVYFSYMRKSGKILKAFSKALTCILGNFLKDGDSISVCSSRFCSWKKCIPLREGIYRDTKMA